MSALQIQAWATVLLVIVAIAAAIYTRNQIKSAERVRRVDRVLELHHQFASDIVGASRMRFSNLMWKAGRCAFENEADPDGSWCWQPSWESIFPKDPARTTGDLNKNRFLGKYPEDIPGSKYSNPVADLRQVLWCIGRINGARERKEIDDALLINLLGWEVVWWYLLCERLFNDRKNGGGVTRPLEALAKWILALKELKESEDLNYMKDRGYPPNQDFPSVPDFERGESKLRDNWKEDGTTRLPVDGPLLRLPGLCRLRELAGMAFRGVTGSCRRSGGCWRGRPGGPPPPTTREVGGAGADAGAGRRTAGTVGDGSASSRAPTGRRSPRWRPHTASALPAVGPDDDPDQHVLRLVVTVTTATGLLPAKIPRSQHF
jgi:hypothetical protein